MKHSGSCHCGAISFEFSGPKISDGVRCNCSLCERKGILMATFTVAAAEMSIHAEKEALRTYQFGTGAAKHFYCGKCGIYTFHTLMSQPELYRVNLGCMAGVNASDLPFTVFDGASI